MKFDKILVPLDGSLFAEAALPKAVELIRNNDEATLILLRAAEATTLPGVDPTDAQVIGGSRGRGVPRDRGRAAP